MFLWAGLTNLYWAPLWIHSQMVGGLGASWCRMAQPGWTHFCLMTSYLPAYSNRGGRFPKREKETIQSLLRPRGGCNHLCHKPWSRPRFMGWWTTLNFLMGVTLQEVWVQGWAKKTWKYFKKNPPHTLMFFVFISFYEALGNK